MLSIRNDTAVRTTGRRLAMPGISGVCRRDSKPQRGIESAGPASIMSAASDQPAELEKVGFRMMFWRGRNNEHAVLSVKIKDSPGNGDGWPPPVRGQPDHCHRPDGQGWPGGL